MERGEVLQLSNIICRVCINQDLRNFIEINAFNFVNKLSEEAILKYRILLNE